MIQPAYLTRPRLAPRRGRVPWLLTVAAAAILALAVMWVAMAPSRAAGDQLRGQVATEAPAAVEAAPAADGGNGEGILLLIGGIAVLAALQAAPRLYGYYVYSYHHDWH